MRRKMNALAVIGQVSPPGDDGESGRSWRRGDTWRRPERMDEGFPEGRRAVCERRGLESVWADGLYWPLSQWRAMCVVEPPRSIPNRVVKRGSAEGTGGVSAGRVGPCAIPKKLGTRGKRLENSTTSLSSLGSRPSLARRGAVAARRAHNPKVGGSNPPAATSENEHV